MLGFGLIDALVQDDFLEDIMVVGPDKPVFVFHRKYDMMRTNIVFYDEQDIRILIDRIARNIGRRIDVQSPLLDARLSDGSRVNATIPPVSLNGSTVTLRKFKRDPYSVVDLVSLGTLNLEVAAFLWMASDGLGAKPANILIAGGTASGKTTTLNMLCSFVPSSERVISIEDTAELNLPLFHWVRFETRPPGIEGTGEITMDMLVKNTLRMRPDRIIVGEIRGSEGFTMFTAMNTGHDGALCGDSLVQFSDGSIKPIEVFCNEQFSKNKVKRCKDFEFVELYGSVKVVSWNKRSLGFEHKPVTRVWRKNKPSKAVKVNLDCGRKVTSTLDHPFYKLDRGIKEVAAGDLKEGDVVAVPLKYDVSAEENFSEPYFAGLLTGDGHVNKNGLSFANVDDGLLREFAGVLEKNTRNSVSISPKPPNPPCKQVQVWDRELAKDVSGLYDLPFGNKTKTFTLSKVLSASGTSLAAFLRGLFDCEAHVNLHSSTIQFSTSNPDVAAKLPIILARFGIFASVNKQVFDGKGNEGPYWRVCVSGRENVSAFYRFIGFSHRQKARALEILEKRSGPSLDLLPNLGSVLAKLRKDAGLSQEAFAVLLGLSSRSSVRAYETGARAPSKKALLAITSRVESVLSKQLELLCRAPVRWVRVTSVEKSVCGSVYDLTVADNHTYVANGVVVSNCFGTVHANSAKETVTRLLSPPISVPDIMLTALNFVVVQHRIHDRRKGTIRRITEVAEVIPIDESKVELQVLYKWNAAKDVLESTNVPVNYFNVLSNFTGLPAKQIKAELKSRQDVLKKLVQGGVRDLRSVCNITQKYVLSKGRSF
ncbi:MAG: ATPase, T2SS/T4P/T4SS family, partial [Candidatus Micrarchaeia archaeon]